jgi:hypothetical protein
LPLILQVAGLDVNFTREMLFSLRQSENLRSTCEGTLSLLQKSADLVFKSMTIIFEERQYWRRVLDADPFEKIQVSFLHGGPMGFVSSMRKLIFNAQIHNKESTIDLKLAILRETFNKLASILGSLYQSGSMLKKISTDIEDMAFTVIDVVDENASRDTSSSTAKSVGVANKDLAFFTFIQKSKERIRRALNNLISALESLEDFSDVTASFDDEESERALFPSHVGLPDLLSHANKKFTVLEASARAGQCSAVQCSVSSRCSSTTQH